MNPSLKCIAFVAASCLFTHRVGALENPPEEVAPTSLKQLSLEQLSEIEVTTVSKEATPAFRAPAAIYVLTQDDIRRSGATTLPDLLRLVPGVEVAQIDSGKWAVGIRGFEGRLSKAVRVLIDGRSVYTPLFAGVYWEVQNVMLEDIERIEVVRGPGATVWGSNAVNGVINIITKNARETRGTLVSATGGNVEQGQLNFRYGAGTDRLSYRIYGIGFTRGPQFHPDDRNFDDWRMGQVGFRLDWVPNKRDGVMLQGNLYGTESGQSLVISRYSPAIAPAVEANGYYSGQNVVGAWQRTFASGSDIQVHAYFDRTDRQDLNYREIRDTFDVDLIHHIPLHRNDIIWGAGARISPSHYFQTVPTVNFIPHKQTYNLFSGFLQDEIAIVPDSLALTWGPRRNTTASAAWNFSRASASPGRRIIETPSGAPLPAPSARRLGLKKDFASPH